MAEDKMPPAMRALNILSAVAKAGEPVSLAELQRKLDLPKPTLHRLLLAMEAEGFLQRHIDGRKFAPSANAREMSVNIIASSRVRAARLAVLRNLSETVGETCNIAIPDRDYMVYLDRFETSWPLRVQLPIGTKVPFHCTASGKVYLSSLRRNQRQLILQSTDFQEYAKNTLMSADLIEAEMQISKGQGYAIDDQEFVDGMIAVAVPVKAPNGRLACTLSFHAPIQRLSLEKAREFVPTLKSKAKELELLLTEEGTGEV